MAEQMIPCTNPRMCGVKSHRPGTEARCKATRSGGATQGKSRLGAPPRPAASEEHPPVELTAGSLRVLQTDYEDHLERKIQVRDQAAKQIEDGMRKQFGLGAGDQVDLVPSSVTHPEDKVIGYYQKQGEPEHRVIQIKSQYLPTEPVDGEVTMEDIASLNEERKAVWKRREEMFDAGLKAVKEDLGKRKISTKYSEVRVNYDSMLGDGEFIQANLYRRGVDQGHLLIPRSNIFPE